MILDYTVMISKEFKYVNTVEKKEAYDIINTVMIMRWLEICEHNWKKKRSTVMIMKYVNTVSHDFKIKQVQ